MPRRTVLSHCKFHVVRHCACGFVLGYWRDCFYLMPGKHLLGFSGSVGLHQLFIFFIFKSWCNCMLHHAATFVCPYGCPFSNSRYSHLGSSSKLCAGYLFEWLDVRELCGRLVFF